VRDGNSAYEEMKKQKFDLVITEICISGLDALQLLRKAKAEALCEHIALCSEIPNFDCARHGIILGAFDYIVKPFDVSLIYSMFNRIKNETYINGASEIIYSQDLIDFFDKHDNSIFEYIDNMMSKIYSFDNNGLSADRTTQQIFKTVVDDVFDKNEWLDLYISKEDLFTPDFIVEGDSETYKKHYQNKLNYLYNEYSQLFPNVNSKQIKDVILYILLNPENDLKQKTIADNLYINTSYLSTVFFAQTNIRFVDYLTMVKLKRASWLLKNTDLKIIDIATRLDYKDIGYFARLFKKQYGLTPSEYRVPENYLFEI
jgi:two-component system response regulator YesN